MSASLEDSAEGHIRVFGWEPLTDEDIGYNKELDRYLASLDRPKQKKGMMILTRCMHEVKK